jgi:VanZ family protein
MISSWKRQLAVANLLYAVVLLSLGVLPSLPSAGVSDHTAHAAAYGIQAGLLYLLLFSFLSRGRAAILAATCAIVWGGIVEALQIVQPTRSFEILDLAANAAGAVVTIAIAYVLTGRTTVESGR